MFLEMTILRTSHQQTVLHSEVTKLKAQALTRTLNTVALRSANYHRVSKRTPTTIGTTGTNNALQSLCAVVAQSDDLGPVVEMWLDFYPKHHQCLRRLAAWQMIQPYSKLKKLIDYHGMFTIGASRDNCDGHTTGFFNAI